jgi:hypothetical protein
VATSPSRTHRPTRSAEPNRERPPAGGRSQRRTPLVRANPLVIRRQEDRLHAPPGTVRGPSTRGTAVRRTTATTTKTVERFLSGGNEEPQQGGRGPGLRARSTPTDRGEPMTTARRLGASAVSLRVRRFTTRPALVAFTVACGLLLASGASGLVHAGEQRAHRASGMDPGPVLHGPRAGPGRTNLRRRGREAGLRSAARRRRRVVRARVSVRAGFSPVRAHDPRERSRPVSDRLKAKRVMTVAIHNPPRPARRQEGVQAGDRFHGDLRPRFLRRPSRVPSVRQRGAGRDPGWGVPAFRHSCARLASARNRGGRGGTGPEAPPVRRARLARIAARRITVGLSPVNVSPPAISGTAAIGATLKATRGTWKNSPTTFAFKWWHCNPRADFRHPCRVILGASQDT